MANSQSFDRPGYVLTLRGVSAVIIKVVVLIVMALHTGSTAAAAEDTENLSPADKRLKQIQLEFESVDIDAKDYTEQRYAIFKKWVNETIRLKGSPPYASLRLVEALSRATAYADRMKAEMLKEDPNVFGGSGGAMPSKPDNGPVKLKDPIVKPKPNASDAGAPASKPPAEKRVIPPMLKGWTSVMRNYIKMKDVKHAKDYAQKIIKDYPNTPEADEAKAVIEMKE